MVSGNEGTAGADSASEGDRRPRRVVQRVSFVIILIGVGALAAAFISSAMAVRYDATAIVGLPATLDAESLVAAANQTSFTGDDGQSLEVVAEGSSIRFVGQAGDPDLAARTANLAATAFVESADPGVTIESAASAQLGAPITIRYQSADAPAPVEVEPERAPDKDTLAEASDDEGDPTSTVLEMLGGEVVAETQGE